MKRKIKMCFEIERDATVVHARHAGLQAVLVRTSGKLDIRDDMIALVIS